MKKLRPQPSVIGAAGEHLVLSHLLRLGYIAGKTPDFTKDYDIVVLNKDGNDSAPIQVKTTTSNGWILKKKHETPIKNLFYCFVKMNFKNENSEIFILDAKMVAKYVTFSHKIWLKLPGRNGKKHNDSEMRKLDENVQKFYKLKIDLNEYLDKTEINFIKEHPKGWLEKYRNAWHLIKT